MQKYHFLRVNPDGTKVIEEREIDRWQWIAHYRNGTELKQFDDNGVFHHVAEIDLKELDIFEVFSPFNPQRFKLIYDHSRMKLFMIYRRLGNTATRGILGTITQFGYIKKVDNLKLHHIIAITPEDQAFITDDFEKVHFE